MADIGTGLRTVLAATTDVTGVINSTVAGSTTPIFPDSLRQGSPLPAIVYQEISGVGQHHAGGASGLARTLVQVDCYAATRLASSSLAELVRLRLDGLRGAMGSETARACHLVNRRKTYEPPTNRSDQGRYRTSLDFRIWHTESAPTLGST